MKLPLAYYGDPILRKKASPVVEINDEIRQLVTDMVDTMDAHNGIGLAANQVHKDLAMFIICVPTPGPDGKWLPGKLWVFINPKITAYTPEEWVCSEGCLSIPTIYEDISRPLKVRVQATNLEGQQFEAEFSHLEAHTVMHENDHINGVLFIDRVRGKHRQELEPVLRDIKKKYYLKGSK